MKKTILFLTIFLSVIHIAKSQEKEDVLYYTPEQNEPFLGSNISVALLPAIIDIYDPNLSFSGGIRSAVRINRYAMIEGNFQIAYLDRINASIHELEEGPFLPAYPNRSARSFEVLGKAFFYSRLADVTEDIHVKTEGNIETYTRIPTQRGEMYALRGGFISGQTFVKSNSGEDWEGYYISEPDNIRNLSFLNQDNGTNMIYNTLAIGLSRSRITDLIVNIAGYGERTSHRYEELYIDFLYAPTINYDNIYIATESEYNTNFSNYREFVVDEHTPKTRVGARIGYLIQSQAVRGLFAGFEGGLRPGFAPMENQFYLNIRLGINFSKTVF